MPALGLEALAVVDDPTNAKRDLDGMTTRKKDMAGPWLFRVQSSRTP
jgi:hypothetical protein